jgi:hypothetical protein
MADTKKFTEAFEALASKFPKRYKVKATLHLQGLLKALAEGDSFISTEIESVRDNLLVVTASGKNLDRLASNYGVERGRATGVQDDDFKRIIPLLGLTQKQIITTLQKIVDVIYGPYASHANSTCSVPAPFKISNSPFLLVRCDGEDFRIEFRPTDAVNPLQATAQELATVVSERTQGRVVGSVVTNVRTGEEYLNIRTATVGPQGFIQVMGGDAQAVLRFPEVRPTRQDFATWNVSRYQGSDEMIFTATSGVSPGMRTAGVKRGDFVAIRQDSGFASENVGSFEVTYVDEDSFRLSNGSGLPEAAITQSHQDDFVFYKPSMANILLSSRPATVLSTGARELTVLLPVTSPIVKRTLKGGHHFHGGLSVAVSNTANTLTVGSANGFPASGSVHIVSSRKVNEGTISSVTGTDVSLISAEGWAQSGSFYAPTEQTFYYYSSITGNTLNGVSPTPPTRLAGTPVKYSERFSYQSIAGNILNNVYPDPTPALGLEVSADLQLEGDFKGSFLYDSSSPFMAAESASTIQESIQQGSSKTVVQVGDVSTWPDSGTFVLEFSTKEQEGPIRYFGKVGTQALIIDPGHVFERDHLKGVTIRLIRQVGAYAPRKSGEDYAVYMTGTSGARTLLAQYIASVIAAGITVKFKILIPDYKWSVLPLLHSEKPLDSELAAI